MKKENKKLLYLNIFYNINAKLNKINAIFNK